VVARNTVTSCHVLQKVTLITVYSTTDDIVIHFSLIFIHQYISQKWLHNIIYFFKIKY